ncbi:MAG: hypothetical protein AVDCRST_MAG01-01-1914, partial [uncultured Rubrobacteraceae bacterium]
AREQPAQGREVRSLGMVTLRRLRGVLHGLQHPGRGRGRPARRDVLSPRLRGLSRSLPRFPQGRPPGRSQV